MRIGGQKKLNNNYWNLVNLCTHAPSLCTTHHEPSMRYFHLRSSATAPMNPFPQHTNMEEWLHRITLWSRGILFLANTTKLHAVGLTMRLRIVMEDSQETAVVADCIYQLYHVLLAADCNTGKSFQTWRVSVPPPDKLIQWKSFSNLIYLIIPLHALVMSGHETSWKSAQHLPIWDGIHNNKE